MKQWENLIIDNETHIIGRGLALSIDLRNNKLTEQEWIDDVLINNGDTLFYNDNLYEIVSIEMKRNLLNGKKSSSIVLIVKNRLNS